MKLHNTLFFFFILRLVVLIESVTTTKTTTTKTKTTVVKEEDNEEYEIQEPQEQQNNRHEQQHEQEHQQQDEDEEQHHVIWRHGWDTISEMIYMHGYNKSIISSDATKFIASHYPAVGFANCYGAFHYNPRIPRPHNNGDRGNDGSGNGNGNGSVNNGNGISQEGAALYTAYKLRSFNPQIKNVFYWKADMDEQVQQCSMAFNTWKKHSSTWMLKNGTIRHGSYHYFDTRNKEFRTFWIQHLVKLAKIGTADNNNNGNMTIITENGEEVNRPLLDAFYIDGMGAEYNPKRYKGLTPIESMSVWKYTRTMVHELQCELDKLGYNQLVIVNGLDTPQGVPIMAEASPASMIDHFAILQFINHNNGTFLIEPMNELLFDVVRSPRNMNRTLIIKAWPGPIIKQRDLWPNHTEPKTSKQMQKEAQNKLNTALALFLLVAEDSTWFSYSWFWNVDDYIPFGKNHTCPDDFYPQFNCPLGKPLGPPQQQEVLVDVGRRGDDDDDDDTTDNDGGGGGGATADTTIDSSAFDVSWDKKTSHLYKRQYEHATIYVNLKNRNETRVVWHKGDPKYCPGAPALLFQEEQQQKQEQQQQAQEAAAAGAEKYSFILLKILIQQLFFCVVFAWLSLKICSPSSSSSLFMPKKCTQPQHEEEKNDDDDIADSGAINIFNYLDSSSPLLKKSSHGGEDGSVGVVTSNNNNGSNDSAYMAIPLLKMDLIDNNNNGNEKLEELN